MKRSVAIATIVALLWPSLALAQRPDDVATALSALLTDVLREGETGDAAARKSAPRQPRFLPPHSRP